MVVELILVSRRERIDRKDFNIKYGSSFEGHLCSTLYPFINVEQRRGFMKCRTKLSTRNRI